MGKDMYPYRVFVSYSHEDRKAAERVVLHLDRSGLRPIWDEELLWGPSFTEQIKNAIAHAHAFIPLVTRASSKRPWVHQEIGYAAGREVPVLPLVIGELPRGMIQQLQALQLRPDLADLAKRLDARRIERMILLAQQESHATFECAAEPEQRARMLAETAMSILTLGKYGRVRQAGALTSFCLPDQPPGNQIWDLREGKIHRSLYYRGLLREERRTLEQHAREGGCDLIISPSIDFSNNGPCVRKVRLTTLLEFIESMTDDKCRVVIRPLVTAQNLLIVGDWFMAESISPQPTVGYLQTICTRHAPTVLNRMTEFDTEFEQRLHQFAPRGVSSRQRAVALLKRTIRRIRSC